MNSSTTRELIELQLLRLPPLQWGLSNFQSAFNERTAIMDCCADILRTSVTDQPDSWALLALIAGEFHHAVCLLLPRWEHSENAKHRSDFTETLKICIDELEKLRSILLRRHQPGASDTETIEAEVYMLSFETLIFDLRGIYINISTSTNDLPDEYIQPELLTNLRRQVETLAQMIDSQCFGYTPKARVIRAEVSFLELYIDSLCVKYLGEAPKFSPNLIQRLPLKYAAVCVADRGRVDLSSKEAIQWVDEGIKILEAKTDHQLDHDFVIATLTGAILHQVNRFLAINYRTAFLILEKWAQYVYCSPTEPSDPRVHAVMSNQGIVLLASGRKPVEVPMDEKSRERLWFRAQNPGSETSESPWREAKSFIKYCKTIAEELEPKLRSQWPSQFVIVGHGTLRFLPWTPMFARMEKRAWEAIPRSNFLHHSTHKCTSEKSVLIYDMCFSNNDFKRKNYYDRVITAAAKLFGTPFVTTYNSQNPRGDDRKRILESLSLAKNVIIFGHGAMSADNALDNGIILDGQKNSILRGIDIAAAVSEDMLNSLLLTCQSGNTSAFVPATSVADRVSAAGCRCTISTNWAIDVAAAVKLLEEMGSSTQTRFEDKFWDILSAQEHDLMWPFGIRVRA